MHAIDQIFQQVHNVVNIFVLLFITAANFCPSLVLRTVTLHSVFASQERGMVSLTITEDLAFLYDHFTSP